MPRMQEEVEEFATTGGLGVYIVRSPRQTIPLVWGPPVFVIGCVGANLAISFAPAALDSPPAGFHVTDNEPLSSAYNLISTLAVASRHRLSISSPWIWLPCFFVVGYPKRRLLYLFAAVRACQQGFKRDAKVRERNFVT